LALTGAIVVSTPQAVALADARKGINMFINDKVNFLMEYENRQKTDSIFFLNV
jgi:Mrp family chromosome partitioning ATPase